VWIASYRPPLSGIAFKSLSEEVAKPCPY